jgi:hypothetical protein
MPFKPASKNAEWTKLTIPIQPFQSAWLEITTTDTLKSYIGELSIQPKSPGSDQPTITIKVPHVGKNLWDLTSHVVTLPPQAMGKFEKAILNGDEARYRLQVPESEIFSESPAPPQWPRLITG